jgi:ABC-type polysaccharide/polyol phosphate export permease
MREPLLTWHAIAVQNRVWGALFLREIQTRYGRRNIGFAWLFLEPLIFAFPVPIMIGLRQTHDPRQFVGFE